MLSLTYEYTLLYSNHREEAKSQSESSLAYDISTFRRNDIPSGDCVRNTEFYTSRCLRQKHFLLPDVLDPGFSYGVPVTARDRRIPPTTSDIYGYSVSYRHHQPALAARSCYDSGPSWLCTYHVGNVFFFFPPNSRSHRTARMYEYLRT